VSAQGDEENGRPARARPQRNESAGELSRLELSPFRMLVYVQCPQKYRYMYHDHIWGRHKKARPDLSLSNSLHLALRGLYRIGGPARHPVAKLLQLYRESWIERGYQDGAQEHEYFERGRAALERFHELERNSVVRSLFAERTLRARLDGYRIFAKIDRLDLLDGGGHEVVCYKTGPNYIGGDEERLRISMPIYHLLVLSNYGSERVKLTVWDVLAGRRDSWFGDRKRLDDSCRDLLAIARRIDEETEFPQRENAYCGWCDFIEHCGVSRAVRVPG
jgi:putative RecB family exonuclease